MNDRKDLLRLGIVVSPQTIIRDLERQNNFLRRQIESINEMNPLLNALDIALSEFSMIIGIIHGAAELGQGKDLRDFLATESRHLSDVAIGYEIALIAMKRFYNDDKQGAERLDIAIEGVKYIASIYHDAIVLVLEGKDNGGRLRGLLKDDFTRPYLAPFQRTHAPGRPSEPAPWHKWLKEYWQHKERETPGQKPDKIRDVILKEIAEWDKHERTFIPKSGYGHLISAIESLTSKTASKHPADYRRKLLG